MTDKLDEALEELVVNTANQYGGFEGFNKENLEHMQLSKNKILAWHTAEVERIIEAIDGNRVDRDATRKHMETKGATEQQILNMEIEADDTDNTIDKIIEDVRRIAEQRKRAGL